MFQTVEPIKNYLFNFKIDRPINFDGIPLKIFENFFDREEVSEYFLNSEVFM